MNGSLSSVKKIVEDLNSAQLDGKTGELTSSRRSANHPEVVIAPPSIYLLQVQEAIKAPVQVSAQNAYTEFKGAFTGEISPEQLKDANIHWVILGHSERRALFGDTDKFVADKVKAAIAAGLSVIACVGESLEEREKNITMEVVERQLEAISNEIKEEDWK